VAYDVHAALAPQISTEGSLQKIPLFAHFFVRKFIARALDEHRNTRHAHHQRIDHDSADVIAAAVLGNSFHHPCIIIGVVVQHYPVPKVARVTTPSSVAFRIVTLVTQTINAVPLCIVSQPPQNRRFVFRQFAQHNGLWRHSAPDSGFNHQCRSPRKVVVRDAVLDAANTKERRR
jgi:hypothetical protein